MANEPLVSVIVGSASDADTIAGARKTLDDYGIPHEAKIFSAHRTPAELVAYLAALPDRGVEIIIAGAGMSAHLAGVVAAHSPLPVLGVPIASGALQGVDALLSTSQMPPGVPVACLGIGSPGAKNAGHLAARILALHHDDIREALTAQTTQMREKVLSQSLPDSY